MSNTDAFNNLSVGATYDKSKLESQIKLFTNKSNRQQSQHSAPSGTQVSDSRTGSDRSTLVPTIRPASTLDLFGTQAKRAGGDDALEADPTDESKLTASGDKPIKPMSVKRMRNIWKKNDLKVSGEGDIPPPIEHLSSLVRPPLAVPKHVVTNLFDRCHKIPTPVQMVSIPVLISRRDMIACAPTGSGKTIAFLVPMFSILKEPNPNVGVRALIVSPTMELAMQIERECFFLMKGQRWKLVQHGQTTKNKDIFITTPGRLVSMIKSKLIALDAVEYLVFDEGDKLWDANTDFLKLVDDIVAHCVNKEKIVSLFTATLSTRVEEMARSVMVRDPVRLIVHDRTSANKNVEQKLVFTGNEIGKVVAMRNLIREGLKPPVLVFMQSIERTKELFQEIKLQGLHVGVMNSKMTAEERDDVVLQFRLGKVWVLITTELLARGIDFKGVGTVINFDFPTTPESYVHRVGRTGRAGKKGLAITFFTEDDKDRLPGIAKIVQDSGSPVEDWMLKIAVGKKRERELAKNTPQRMIVNTKKRIMVGQQRINRQLKAAERDRAEAKEKGLVSDNDSEEEE